MMEKLTKKVTTFTRITTVLSAVTVCSFLLAAWSFYNGHQSYCAGRNKTLDVLHDMIVIATTPHQNQKLTADQKANISKFRKATFARIDQARC